MVYTVPTSYLYTLRVITIVSIMQYSLAQGHSIVHSNLKRTIDTLNYLLKISPEKYSMLIVYNGFHY